MRLRYTIAWKRNLPDVDLDGVEYQCLPSGLHSVQSDLVYFVHGNYAGVSAFAKESSDAQHRNASFAAVGVLIPLSYGRLGRGWLHADELRRLAKGVVKNTNDTRALELYWKKHREDNAAKQKCSDKVTAQVAQDITSGKRKRVQSDATEAMRSEPAIAPDHPALAVLDLLDAFGPLVYPLYRAALLRKRILFLGTPPVQRSCNFLYILSVLSSIPPETSEVLQSATADFHRSQTLFSVGVNDIPRLQPSTDNLAGYLATTTDDILGEKEQLYDLLFELPALAKHEDSKQWPRLVRSDRKVIKASQRDLRRYRALRLEMRRLKRGRRSSDTSRYRDNDQDQEEQHPLLRSTTTLHEAEESGDLNNNEGEVVEPASWTAVAYRSFMWWASAGEQDAFEAEEEAADQLLLHDLPRIDDATQPPSSINNSQASESSDLQNVATVLVAYFHRITSRTLQIIADMVEDADDETEEGLAEDAIQFDSVNMQQVGLDAWSDHDKVFLRDLTKLYFDRDAVLEEGGVRMCGMRLC